MIKDAFVTLFLIKGLANLGRLNGGASMSISASGFRMHRHPQDSDMDFAWQELMAITELQVG